VGAGAALEIAANARHALVMAREIIPRSSDPQEAGFLEGQFLIAMPSLGDPNFERTVIYMCAHSPSGAMGLVVNRLADHITFPELLRQLKIDDSPELEKVRVHVGGPVETGRGFVLHSTDYMQESTLRIADDLGRTATVDILKAIAEGNGPRHALLALGYAQWGPGQLEAEIQANGWLHADAGLDILFETAVKDRWPRAVSTLGFEVSRLSTQAGHA
jgi:putative transcriptional regulator